MIKFSLIVICLTSFTVFSQDAKVDFKKINKVYFELEKLSMDVSYELFFDDETTPSDKESGFFKRDKNNYNVKQSDNELLINERYMVLIDNENKTIILDKSKGGVNNINPLNVDLDSMFHFYSKVEFYKTGKNKNLSAYTFTLKQGPYSKIDVVFDPVTFLVSEITSVFSQKMADANDVMRSAKLKVTFFNINIKPTFKHEFDETKFVSNGKQAVKTSANFSNYKLLTNLKKI